jgi:capsular polysaccharide biosynthesis protein
MIDQTTASPAAPGMPLRLHDYVQAARARKWLIACVALSFVSLAAVISIAQPPRYDAAAEVLVKPLQLFADEARPGNPNANAINMETEKQIATSARVATIAVKKLGLPERPDVFLESLSVRNPPKTEVLVLTYSAPRPQEARQRAQVVAESYLEFRRNQATIDLLAASQAVDQRIRLASQHLDELNRQIPAANNDIERQTLQAEANLFIDALASLRQRSFALVPADNLRVGEILQEASLPRSRAAPKYAINMVVGLIVGLLAGMWVAITREVRRAASFGSD